MLNKIYALVDCNAFFCSCERLFRPDLEGKPVGVLSNNDGCFVSRSVELKKLGVKMAQPYFEVRDLCEQNNVAVFSSNFSFYTNISDRVMITLAQFSPCLEVYSVDEAFLDLTGFEHLDLIEYAKEIKKTVEMRTGIPVCVGIGPSKTLAKMANHLAKDSKKAKGVVSLLDERHRKYALKKCLVREVWGVGKASANKLYEIGVKSAYDLSMYHNKIQIQKILTKRGLIIMKELQGIPLLELVSREVKKQEIMCSRTFSESADTVEKLRKALANYATAACEKLRAQESLCSSVKIFISTPPYKNVSQAFQHKEVKIPSSTSNTFHVINYALSALEDLFKTGYEYQKAGVRLGGIINNGEGQLGLFDSTDTEESDKLMSIVDHINQKYGETLIKSAACGSDREYYAMRRNYKSPDYLLGWGSLPKVK